MSQWTFHGGRLAEARAAYGGEDWLDLSTGINPTPWPGAETVTIDWAGLPDEAALRALEAAAASAFGIDPAFVCAVPGTEIGLRLLPDIVGPITACGMPAYRTHSDLVSPRVMLEPIALPHRSGNILLANPNNPDGAVLSRTTLLSQLDAIAPTDHWLVLDEAFADAMPGISLADRIADDRRLMIFRSFGKFFGLAGLRLGFVLGPRAIVDRYRARLGSWPVSAAALAIGTPAYRDVVWAEAMRVDLASRAAAFDGILRRHGFDPIGDCPLFRLIEMPDAAQRFERLARLGILTRPFDYAPRWLRLGVSGNADDLARLDRALADG